MEDWKDILYNIIEDKTIPQSILNLKQNKMKTLFEALNPENLEKLNNYEDSSYLKSYAVKALKEKHFVTELTISEAMDISAVIHGYVNFEVHTMFKSFKN